jgi:phenylacetate-CoA ligase
MGISAGLKNLYDRTPVGLQNLLLTAYSIKLDRQRYRGRFGEFQALMLRMESAGAADVSAYQNSRLQQIVEHAYRTVPYYTRVFDERRLTPADIRTAADLPKLPLLTKAILKANFDQLWSRAFERTALLDGHTSGTTGTPMEVLYDSGMMAMTYAALDRQYRWAGCEMRRFGDRVAVLRGNIIVPLAQQRPPFWRVNWYHNQLLLSNFHMSPENLPAYFEEMRRFKPTVLDGYPSSVYVFAKVLLNRGERLPLRAVLTSSETLFDFQRDAMEEAFQCQVFDYYGAAERVAFAAECGSRQGHHLFPEYGITEIVDEHGTPLPDGTEGTMVGTSIQNYGMPLLRWVTSDRTALTGQPCPCGRPLPLMQDVTTKAEDLLRLKDGRLISPSVLTHPFKPLNEIDGSQLVQTALDRLVVRLIPRADFTPAHSERLVRDLKARLGQDMQVDIEMVTELPRTKAGKFKWVISDVGLGL